MSEWVGLCIEDLKLNLYEVKRGPCFMKIQELIGVMFVLCNICVISGGSHLNSDVQNAPSAELDEQREG